MTTLNATVTRRTFLCGAGASVAITVARTAANILLPPAPLPVDALTHGADALAGLEAALASPHLSLRAILLAPPHGAALRPSTGEEWAKVASAVGGLLARTGSKVPVFELRPDGLGGPSFVRKPSLPTLLLGSFSGYWAITGSTNRADPHPAITRLLRASPRVYVDDPLLATRVVSAPAMAAVAPRTMAGLCSSVDPAVDFALSHVRSGAIGRVTSISTSLRARDAANHLEAKAIHQRLQIELTSESLPSLRRMRVATVRPTIDIRGASGHLQIALYSAHDRRVTLPVRLQYFTLSAQGDAGS